MNHNSTCNKRQTQQHRHKSHNNQQHPHHHKHPKSNVTNRRSDKRKNNNNKNNAAFSGLPAAHSYPPQSYPPQPYPPQPYPPQSYPHGHPPPQQYHPQQQYHQQQQYHPQQQYHQQHQQQQLYYNNYQNGTYYQHPNTNLPPSTTPRQRKVTIRHATKKWTKNRIKNHKTCGEHQKRQRHSNEYQLKELEPYLTHKDRLITITKSNYHLNKDLKWNKDKHEDCQWCPDFAEHHKNGNKGNQEKDSRINHIHCPRCGAYAGSSPSQCLAHLRKYHPEVFERMR